MASFIPLSFQKKLLRYALSRIDILDADALNLESLDIGWRRSSTIEVRNVALHKNKLARILKLPPSFSIASASVSALKLTVPVNPATSPIELLLQGVRVTVHTGVVVPTAEQDGSRSQPPRASPTSGHKTSAGRSDQDKATLPTPQDLAQSFLEHEPTEEKAQLEAELNSQSIELGQSTASLDIEDDGFGYGYAATFSLPTFLGTFIQGILDRMQVTIEDVVLGVEGLLDLPPSGLSPTTTKPAKVSTGLRVSISKLESLGTVQEDAGEDADTRSQGQAKIGRRLISASNIDVSLYSTSKAFEQWQKLADKDDMRRDHVSPTHSWVGPSPRDESGPMSTPGKVHPVAATTGLKAGPPQLSTHSFDNSEVSPLTPFVSSNSEGLSGAFNAFGKPARARTDDTSSQSVATLGHSAERESKVSVPAQESLAQSSGIHNVLGSFREERRPLSSPSAVVQSTSDIRTPFKRDRQSGSLRRSKDRDVYPSVSGPSVRNSWSQDLEDEDALTESRLFSAHEAESLYLSVMEDSLSSRNSNSVGVPELWAEEDCNRPGSHPTPSPKPLDDMEAKVQHQQPDVSNTTVRTNAGDSVTAQEEQASTIGKDDTQESTVVSKSLINFDKVSVWLPATDPNSSGLDQQGFSQPHASSIPHARAYATMPGTFSIYSDTPLSHVHSTSAYNTADEDGHQAPEQNGLKNSASSAVLIEVGSAESRVDLPLCAMVSHFGRHIVDAFPESSSSRENNASPQDSASPKLTATQEVRLSIAQFRLNLCDYCSAIGEPITERQTLESRSDLFVFSAESLKFQHQTSGLGKTDLLTINTLKLQLAGQDVLDFNAEKASQRGIRTGRQEDTDAISITSTMTAASTQIEVATAPVKLDLDLFRLDERLATFGGFSGLLEVGSLVLSETTISRTAKVKTDSPTRPRTVHFEPARLESQLDESRSSNVKTNVRVGGSSLKLRGRGSSIGCQTSAIKIVHRQSIFGVQIDRIAVTGPVTPNKGNIAAKIDIDNFGVKYLFSPEEQDLTRLVALLAPSKNKFADDDDLLVETLIRQRRHGAVARLSLTSVIVDTSDEKPVQAMADFWVDLMKLSNITEYLPKESRPGLLALGYVRSAELHASDARGLGGLCLKADETEFAHVGSPLLFALACGQLGLTRDSGKPIIRSLLPLDPPHQPFVLMVRMIGDEIEPTAKIKLSNICFEYDADLAADLQKAPVAEVQESPKLAANTLHFEATQMPASGLSGPQIVPVTASKNAGPLRIHLQFHGCGIGLSPRGLPSKGLVVLSDAGFTGTFEAMKPSEMRIAVKKGTMLLTDDANSLKPLDKKDLSSGPSVVGQQVPHLCKQGYVSVCWLSAVEAVIRVSPVNEGAGPPLLNIDVQDELLVLETCADSTQTLSQLFGALSPPSSAPPTGHEFRTEIAPVADMMASFTGDAFTVPTMAEGATPREDDSFTLEDSDERDTIASASLPNLAMDESLSALSAIARTPEQPHASAHESFFQAPEHEFHPSEEIVSGKLRPTHMSTHAPSTVCKWNSSTNRFALVTMNEVKKCPCTFRVRNMHVIWNLHDGYDWQTTREKISKAVSAVETKTKERRSRHRQATADDDDDDSVINDFLFNSIYIGIPAHQEPHEFARQINRNVNDTLSETASHLSDDTARTVTIPGIPRRPQHKLHLERSRRQKLTFELQGVSADFVLFEAGSETVSSTVLNIQDLDIFDHVPTSTWRKFATYQEDAGIREDKKPMIKVEFCNVKPVPTLTASELVVRVTVLPLRLHIDQDALDFMTRFFDFHDEEAESKAGGSAVYLQRVEVRPVMVKLDYKPKKVDYVGLRSGRTKEFMNFFNLDGADIVLKHAIIYGCPSFARLHHNLEDIWMPDIKKTQLPGILSGLNGVRTLVNVGGGFRNLVVIPVQEYQKDGRVIRSVSKGATSFVRTTGSELTKFGARLAVGAQNALQSAEEILSGQITVESKGTDDNGTELGLNHGQGGYDDLAERGVHSNFADQPTGIMQGLKGAARNLERDLLLTRDVIIAVSGEVMQSGSAEGAARVVARHAPTLVLRPMIGASKAISQTLMGATNSVDPQNRRRMSDKYKRY